MSEPLKTAAELYGELWAPSSYEDAVAARTRIIDETERLQDLLGAETDPRTRQRALADLRLCRHRLRVIKEWLRKNDSAKLSEWQLLSLAYHELQAILPLVPSRTESIETLLDAIERVVPGNYLETHK